MARRTQHPYITELKRLFSEGRCDRREFLRTATLLGLSAAAAYRFTGAAEAQTNPATNVPRGGTARIGVRLRQIESAHKNNFVPPSNVLRQVCEYLTKTGYDNVTRPYLLEKWTPSDDLRTWTLTLRQDVKWHSGRAFTADDVIWNLKQVLDPAVGSSSLGLMAGYMMNEENTTGADGKPKKTYKLWDANAIEKVDDHTVRLNLKIGQLAVPEHLFHYATIMTDPEQGETFSTKLNGTGAFELVEYQVGQRATFKPRKDYWNGAPYLDELVFVDLGDDPGAEIAALASRQVHLISAMGATQLEPCKQFPNLVYYPADTASCALARMHPVPPFDDKRVRQAMRYAVDSPTVAKIALGDIGSGGEHQHVSPIHPEYYKLPPFNRDVAKAKQLLADAGHPNGIDVELACPNSGWHLAICQVMIQHWADAGIRAKLNVIPSAEYNKIWKDPPLGFTDWSHRPLGVMCLSLAYRTGVPWNESQYSNPEFDKLLDQAEATADVEKRRAVMAKLEEILQDDGPIVQPVWRKVFCFADQKLKGFRMHPTQYIFCEEYGVEA
jgi:peptide/nickel transport system substrate-binding protein